MTPPVACEMVAPHPTSALLQHDNRRFICCFNVFFFLFLSFSQALPCDETEGKDNYHTVGWEGILVCLADQTEERSFIILGLSARLSDSGASLLALSVREISNIL